VRRSTCSLDLPRPYVHEKNLVDVVLDDVTETRPKLDQRAMRELATKDRELRVLAVALHELKDFAQSLGSQTSYVTMYVWRMARTAQRVRNDGYSSISPRRHLAKRRAWTSRTRR